MSRHKRIRFSRYNDLMPNRVREVLLLSSLYDAFVLQEDGHLTEQVFLEYKELSLSSAPRFTHVNPTSVDMEKAMQSRRFDMVLIVARLTDMNVESLARRAKETNPERPVVVLAFDNTDLKKLNSFKEEPSIDDVFAWTGDMKILLAMIKTVEDRKNLDNDIECANLKMILVVEDSVRYYSSFLSVLYPELMKQSQSLFSEGMNRLQRLMRMRTRPKIIHTTTYDEALELARRYKDNLMGVICDVGFPRGEEHDPEAGLRLIRELRNKNSDLPLLLQSSEEKYQEVAKSLKVFFVNKTSSDLHDTIRDYLSEHLGFGAFVFRMPDGSVVARASDTHELENCIRDAPAESLEFHAERNHFSNWLMARSEFYLAKKWAKKEKEDFNDAETLRQHMIRELKALRESVGAGIIADFFRHNFDMHSLVYRLGEGSLGGKARGIAFLNFLLSSEACNGKCGNMRTCLPATFVLTTSAFDEFMSTNGLYDYAFKTHEHENSITRRFLAGRTPTWVREDLRAIIEKIRYPLAVRSSSLLEDNMLHPFAGIYGTVMVPNNNPDPDVRLNQLLLAVKYVYASTFFSNAKAYMSNAHIPSEEEKMAVVIQQLVGNKYGNRFYPHFAGVCQSHNYYPIAPQKPQDGVAQMVLGLGQMVVSGGATVRFSPKYPEVQPQTAVPRMLVQNAQKYFYALDLSSFFPVGSSQPGHNLTVCELEDAEKDGTLAHAVSVYNPEDDIITESLNVKGPQVITFNNILKHKSIPLAPALDELLQLTSHGMGTEVEIEFACDMGDWGKPRHRGKPRKEPTLYPLQVRPIVTLDAVSDLPEEDIGSAQQVVKSNNALGHGRRTDIRDVAYVKHASFDPGKSPQIAGEVGVFNRKLSDEERGYILIGPGRWGSNDHWLGIPVEWQQISGARIIVEASPENYKVDPSQGTHFFHNMTSLGIGYFTIPPGATPDFPKHDSFVDWKWLDTRRACEETDFIRHVRLEEPLIAIINGRTGEGRIAVKPEPANEMPPPSMLQ